MKETKAETLQIKKLHPFEGHPFKVADNEEMDQLVESILAQGVLTPLVGRPLDNGEYEVISGHRRLHACKRAGIESVPALITEMDRDAAAIALVDSNLHREHILPSEKAFAFKMKRDALNRQGTSRQVGEKLSVTQISEASNDSERQVHRYIRLTNLIPGILEMVDEGKMALTPAVEISRLPIEAQKMLYRECELCDCTPSYSQTVRMRKINEVRELTWHDLAEIMSEEKANQKEKVTLFMDDLKKYYPRSATAKDIADDIMKMLESRYKARRNRDAR